MEKNKGGNETQKDTIKLTIVLHYLQLWCYRWPVKKVPAPTSKTKQKTKKKKEEEEEKQLN